MVLMHVGFDMYRKYKYGGFRVKNKLIPAIRVKYKNKLFNCSVTSLLLLTTISKDWIYKYNRLGKNTIVVFKDVDWKLLRRVYRLDKNVYDRAMFITIHGSRTQNKYTEKFIYYTKNNFDKEFIRFQMLRILSRAIKTSFKNLIDYINDKIHRRERLPEIETIYNIAKLLYEYIDKKTYDRYFEPLSVYAAPLIDEVV